jgi:hypothetical protein
MPSLAVWASLGEDNTEETDNKNEWCADIEDSSLLVYEIVATLLQNASPSVYHAILLRPYCKKSTSPLSIVAVLVLPPF